jgi:DNA-directed RNA polymerase specialized sigma24 family protein
MSSTGSVSHWLAELRSGNRDAAQPLWERYFARLVRLARKRLRDLGVARRVADEEDVALCAFDSFCRATEQGRFPRLEDRDDLWAVLVCVTARKALDLKTHERRIRRGGGKVAGESVLDALLGTAEGRGGIEQVVSREPAPDIALQEAEMFLRLLAKLPTKELRSIALDRVEGYTNAEIAVRQKCALSTVERRLDLIRKCWAEEPRS